MRQSAAAFDISTVGESAANISEDFQQVHPEIPWTKMRGMRNRLVHIFDYEQIDYDIVWGKEHLTDSWWVTPHEPAKHHFFRVTDAEP